MKKITLSLVLLLISTVIVFAGTWQKLDLTKVGGGTINLNINRLFVDGGKLYAATFDGIWVSPSANGGDWTAFGLQGINVTHLNFGVLKLANVQITATDDVTKFAYKLYKYNGTNWVITALNPTTTSTFGGPSSAFTQIQDAGNHTIILYPTWGGGIWRSADGGDTWTNYAQGTTTDGAVYKNVLGLFSFPGNPIVYGTDKVSNYVNYMISSADYGVTWINKPVGAFFNPYSLLARKVGGANFLYYGGQNGNGGVLWRSGDAGSNWDASLTTGVPYWEIRKIIGENDGSIYALSSVNNVYKSTDNGDTFSPVGVGITIPATRTTPASGIFYLSDIINSGSKLYVSAIMTDGIYVYNLTTGVNSPKTNTVSIYPNPAQNELFVNAESGAKISIYTVTGKLVTSEIATNTKTSINIKDLNASVYIVKVITNDGKLSTNRFVKK